jgi:anti-sigma regulatory factor (Ser/Thr protein kinase)
LEKAYWVGVGDSTHTAEARRKALELASRLGFEQTEAGKVGLVVTEAAKNLLKHAGGGDLIVRAIQHGGDSVLETLALDKGPGIEDVARSFQDGYSTTGTPGTGLGAIARLSSLYDIYSQRSQGTALMAQVAARPRLRETGNRTRFRVGGVSVAKHGEPVSGDEWEFFEYADGCRLMVADGLGHGLLASDAAHLAVSFTSAPGGEDGAKLMERIHGALRPTRGAAVAMAEIDRERGGLRYTGLGNISGTVIAPSGAVQHLVSHPGTAGHEVHKITTFNYPWLPGSILIMHSDGLSSHWSLEKYPGLSSRHPSVIAGVLYRDFHRQRDDTTVVVLEDAGDRE